MTTEWLGIGSILLFFVALAWGIPWASGVGRDIAKYQAHNQRMKRADADAIKRLNDRLRELNQQQ